MKNRLNKEICQATEKKPEKINNTSGRRRAWPLIMLHHPLVDPAPTFAPPAEEQNMLAHQ